MLEDNVIMPVYTYKALSSESSPVSGTIVAHTPREARDSLRQKGLTIEEVRRVEAHAKSGIFQRWSQWRHARNTLELTRELSTLLGVGIPLVEALETLARPHRGRFRAVILKLREAVSAGRSLSDAMSEEPGVFDDLTLHLVEVGETAGSLETTLERVADFKEKSIELKNRVGNALLYPLLVLLIGTAVTLFLMTFVVPQLLNALVEAGKPLPFSTRVVKTASDLLLHYWWLLLAAAGLAGSSLALFLQTARGLKLWHSLQLRAPVIGPLIRKQAIARMAVVLSTLLRNGMVFIKALHVTGKTVQNVVLREALVQCEQAIQAGQDIARALEEPDVFPPAVIHLFAVGQQSGRLEEMLERLALDYDRQVQLSTQRLATLVEPTLIVILAVIVGWIAFATMMPILQAGNIL